MTLTLPSRLTAEWHPTRNGELKPSDVTPGSNRKLWWVCGKGHEFSTTVYNRVSRNRNCSVCANKQILEGYNDLQTTHPELVKEWDFKKNTINPTNIVAGSHTKVHWVCSKKHTWVTSVKKRAITGTACPYCAGNKIWLGFNDLQTTHPELVKEWDSTNLKPATTYSAGSEHRAKWECSKGHKWDTEIRNRRNGAACPICVSGESASKAEKELAVFIKQLLPNNIKVKLNDRKTVPGYELDIHIPSLKIAVEYNGIYWHSEASGKPKTYHYDKWLACRNAGIQLYQIWEDDYTANPELIKRTITHKLGASNQKKMFARNTIPVLVTRGETQIFLHENHIQGFASGSHYIGLKDESNTLVAVMVLKTQAGDTLNIIRYATNVNVPGGFTKLLKHAIKQYNPTRFITFSDNTISDGGLYQKNGFVADRELPPDYMYLVKNQRKHKFGYRLKKFRTDPTLKYKEGLSETQLAKLNSLHRVWDAGKTRWVYNV